MRAVLEEAAPASPCTNVCRMNAATGYCEGCSRTIEEIACWSGYGEKEKRAVLAKLQSRKPAFER